MIELYDDLTVGVHRGERVDGDEPRSDRAPADLSTQSRSRGVGVVFFFIGKLAQTDGDLVGGKKGF